MSNKNLQKCYFLSKKSLENDQPKKELADCQLFLHDSALSINLI